VIEGGLDENGGYVKMRILFSTVTKIYAKKKDVEKALAELGRK